MGTETQRQHYLRRIDWLKVKLNNPQMGTETILS